MQYRYLFYFQINFKAYFKNTYNAFISKCTGIFVMVIIYMNKINPILKKNNIKRNNWRVDYGLHTDPFTYD